MKKIIFAIMMLITTPVMAENWTAIADIDSGGRLLLDVDSLENDNNFVRGVFKIYSLENSDAKAVIDSKYCEKGEGPLAMMMIYSRKPSFSTFFYNKSGEKLYDQIGIALCKFNEMVKNKEYNDSRVDPK